jgi:hypothetical protein
MITDTGPCASFGLGDSPDAGVDVLPQRAGIHFRTADLQGVKLGTTVARYLHRHYFQPTHHHHGD